MARCVVGAGAGWHFVRGRSRGLQRHGGLWRRLAGGAAVRWGGKSVCGRREHLRAQGPTREAEGRLCGGGGALGRRVAGVAGHAVLAFLLGKRGPGKQRRERERLQIGQQVVRRGAGGAVQTGRGVVHKEAGLGFREPRPRERDCRSGGTAAQTLEARGWRTGDGSTRVRCGGGPRFSRGMQARTVWTRGKQGQTACVG